MMALTANIKHETMARHFNQIRIVIEFSYGVNK